MSTLKGWVAAPVPWLVIVPIAWNVSPQSRLWSVSNAVATKSGWTFGSTAFRGTMVLADVVEASAAVVVAVAPVPCDEADAMMAGSGSVEVVVAVVAMVGDAAAEPWSVAVVEAEVSEGRGDVRAAEDDDANDTAVPESNCRPSSGS